MPGRPKGADLSVIGLPRKRKHALSLQKPTSFLFLGDQDQEPFILQMIVKEDTDQIQKLKSRQN